MFILTLVLSLTNQLASGEARLRRMHQLQPLIALLNLMCIEIKRLCRWVNTLSPCRRLRFSTFLCHRSMMKLIPCPI